MPALGNASRCSRLRFKSSWENSRQPVSGPRNWNDSSPSYGKRSTGAARASLRCTPTSPTASAARRSRSPPNCGVTFPTFESSLAMPMEAGTGHGFWTSAAAGVDSHPAFVEAGRSRGLDMVLGDGIEHLATRPANSLDIVTAFHVIEHLDVETLLALIEAANDALRIGGCLLLETPNPHNLQMAACDFSNDPTHRRPLPPALVEFLVSASGFERVEIRPLHPASSPLVGLNDDQLGIELVERALYGPQDYAVLGYKIDSMD